MNISLSRILYLYGVGSLGGFCAVLLQWLVRQLAGTNIAFMTSTLNLDALYGPMVWGGIWAQLYLVPLHTNTMWKAALFFWGPAFTYLGLYGGGFTGVGRILAPDNFMRQEIFILLAIYFVAWGILTSILAKRAG